jgi:hypothetical protein
MSFIESLPEPVVELLRQSAVAEYATVSAAGVPIDTPTFVFTSGDLQTLDLGTGLAYPAKAERARRNPKVGLLFEGADHQPVVSIAGVAAVRDADLQSNLDRYLAETIFTPTVNPELVDWSTIREMVWYLARIIVCVAPVRIRWWNSRAEMDAAPRQWRADPAAIFPKSDPEPRAAGGETLAWSERSLSEMVQTALRPGGSAAHLTTLDADGYPLPMRASEVVAHPGGFRLAMPKGALWSLGKATLSFGGKEIFVGETRLDGEALVFDVERALPTHPFFSEDGKRADTYVRLMERVEREAQRRGQPIPRPPAHPPKPTDGAKLREQASRQFAPPGT